KNRFERDRCGEEREREPIERFYSWNHPHVHEQPHQKPHGMEDEYESPARESRDLIADPFGFRALVQGGLFPAFDGLEIFLHRLGDMLVRGRWFFAHLCSLTMNRSSPGITADVARSIPLAGSELALR